MIPMSLIKFESQSIATTLPMMQHVVHSFSAEQQGCLALMREATQPFEVTGTASDFTRSKPSERISNSADRT